MSSERVCFIRRSDGRGWVRSRKHHYNALVSFLNNKISRVTVPHEDGGNFVGEFTCAQYDEHTEKYTQNTLCSYIDEYGNSVDIMICEPSYAAYINRIVDY